MLQLWKSAATQIADGRHTHVCLKWPSYPSAAQLQRRRRPLSEAGPKAFRRPPLPTNSGRERRRVRPAPKRSALSSNQVLTRIGSARAGPQPSQCATKLCLSTLDRLAEETGPRPQASPRAACRRLGRPASVAQARAPLLNRCARSPKPLTLAPGGALPSVSFPVWGCGSNDDREMSVRRAERSPESHSKGLAPPARQTVTRRVHPPFRNAG